MDIAALIFIQSFLIQSGALFSFRWIGGRFWPKLIKQNFQGKPVSVVGGIAFIAALGLLVLRDFSAATSIVLTPLIILASSFGLLGLCDDIFGDRSTGGFTGHINALIKHGRVTTGLIKAVGGPICALAAMYLYFCTPGLKLSTVNADIATGIVLSAILIALSANTINLLDTRPGRASSTALIGFILLFAIQHFEGWYVVREYTFPLYLGSISTLTLVLIAMLVAVYSYDRSTFVMLGDTGSNSIGAVLGLIYVFSVPHHKDYWLLGGVVLLLAFNLWCEKHSVSKLIEDTPCLRALDRKIGVR